MICVWIKVYFCRILGLMMLEVKCLNVLGSGSIDLG